MGGTSRVEILLIEDEPTDVEFFLRAAKKQGCESEVAVVRDGEEAMDFVLAKGRYVERRVQDKPKLILLDLRLPKVSGLEVLRRMKSDDLTRDMPVVVLTSSREPRDIEEAYGLHANAYVPKPMDYEGYLEMVPVLFYFWVSLNQTPY